MKDSPWYRFIGQCTNPATGKPYKTTYQVAKAANIGRGYLSNYFTGPSHPDNMHASTLEKVAKALGRKIDEVKAVMVVEKEYRSQETGQAAQA